MSQVVGGLRAQYIRESIYRMLHQSLTDLGWFDAGRKHKPLSFPGVTETNDNEIPINRIALNDEDMYDNDLEMGSNGVVVEWTYWVDFYAQNDSLGKHVIYDIKDILGGRMSSIGRDYPNVQVYDFKMATPVPIFKVGIEDIVVDRGARSIGKPYQKHWYACRFTVTDAYHDESVDGELDP